MMSKNIYLLWQEAYLAAIRAGHLSGAASALASKAVSDFSLFCKRADELFPADSITVDHESVGLTD